MELRDLYILWCKEKGFNHNTGKALNLFFNIIKKD